MGILRAPPKLDPGEQLRWQCNANHVGKMAYDWKRTSPSSGELFLTDRRVVFQPGRVDALTGSKPWECPSDAVTGIELVGRDSDFTGGGLRERLGIRTGEDVEVFVVNKLENKMRELRELLPRLG